MISQMTFEQLQLDHAEREVIYFMADTLSQFTGEHVCDVPAIEKYQKDKYPKAAQLLRDIVEGMGRE